MAGALIQSAAIAKSVERRFLIKPGTLGSAAIAIGRQASVSVVVLDPRLASSRVPGLSGQMDTESALRRLAEGAGARVIRIGADSFKIVAGGSRRPPTPRPATRPQRPAAPVVEASAVRGDDIVVVASRRSIRLKDYAGQIVRLSPLDIDNGIGGLPGSEILQSTTPIVSSTQFGPGRNKLFLRGIADSSVVGPTRATIAQYFGDARTNNAGPDPSLKLFDIEAIEILPGSESVIYGSGALAGVIRTEPARPDLTRLSTTIEAGGTAQQSGSEGVDLATAINLPLIDDRAAVRLVAYRSHDGGFINVREPSGRDGTRIRRNVNASDTIGGRALARIDFPEDWRIDLMGLYQKIDSDDAQYAVRRLPDLERDQRLSQPYLTQFGLGNISVQKKVGDRHFLASASLSRQAVKQRFDATSTVSVGDFDNDIDYLVGTLDVRAWERADDGRGWVLGLSGLGEEIQDTRRRSGDSVDETAIIKTNRMDIAIFGEATLPLSPKVKADVGLRVGQSSSRGERLDQRARGRGSSDDTYLTPSARLSWTPSDGNIVYVRYAEGFRPAGFSISGNIVSPFKPDRIRTAETGIRIGTAANIVSGSAAVAITRWTNIQADLLDLRGLPQTINIGNGWIQAINVDGHWRPVDGLQIDGSIALNHSRLKSDLVQIIDPGQTKVPNVAPIDARLASRHEFAVGGRPASVFANLRYSGRSVLGSGTILGREQGPWLTINSGAFVDVSGFRLSLGLNNLLNSKASLFALGNPFRGADETQFTPPRPRSVRVGVSTSF